MPRRPQTVISAHGVTVWPESGSAQETNATYSMTPQTKGMVALMNTHLIFLVKSDEYTTNTLMNAV